MKTEGLNFLNMKSKKIIVVVILAIIVFALVVGFRLFDSELLSLNTQSSTSLLTVDGEFKCGSFNKDSAYIFCKQQCNFGPRTMNSEAHERCADFIVKKFESYGLHVVRQTAVVNGYDGTELNATNIIASINPEQSYRILICAHWDSRPWADNDPLESNHKIPVLAANDGASGVAVMLELARILVDKTTIGVDFICFDAEDWGVPQWADIEPDDDSWALGAQYWSTHPHTENYKAQYGVLLDMVGGKGAHFYREGFSQQYAPGLIDEIWGIAHQIGFGNYFINAEGKYITDDHRPINEVVGIPTIDIISYYPNCHTSSFGPTWHTVQDTMENIDSDILGAVGLTLEAWIRNK